MNCGIFVCRDFSSTAYSTYNIVVVRCWWTMKFKPDIFKIFNRWKLIEIWALISKERVMKWYEDASCLLYSNYWFRFSFQTKKVGLITFHKTLLIKNSVILTLSQYVNKIWKIIHWTITIRKTIQTEKSTLWFSKPKIDYSTLRPFSLIIIPTWLDLLAKVSKYLYPQRRLLYRQRSDGLSFGSSLILRNFTNCIIYCERMRIYLCICVFTHLC